MSKKLLQIIRDKQREDILKHMPAKDAVTLDDKEQSDLDAFVQAFDDAWLASADTSRNIEDDGFHPSSLGIAHGKCARRNVYLLRGTPKEARFNPRILRVFANGHAVHDRLQRTLLAMDIQMESEVKIESDNPPIRGHADGVIVWRGRKILIEIKSCSDEVFINRLKWKKPKDEHFAQANIYAWILGINTVWVIYEDKNTQELKFFEKPTDSESAEKIVNDWHAQWLVHQDGELPKRPYKPSSPVCAGCDMKGVCFGDATIGIDLKPYRERVQQLQQIEATN